MDNYLKKLQEFEIEILNEIDRICLEEDIEYFLVGGTLLGAVRHGGFIPWDDDIDIGMTRKNYNKFIKVCKNKLNERFILDNIKTNNKIWHLYSKVKLKNTILLEPLMEDYDINHGIWVDVFPYDNVNTLNSFTHRLKNKFRLFMMSLLFRKLDFVKESNFNNNHKILSKIIDTILKIFPIKFYTKLSSRIISMCKNDNSKYICNMTGTLTMDKETHLREKIFPLSKIKFGDREYMCPNDYDYMLTKQYGNYMKVPPPEKRVTHNPLMVKFEDGEKIIFSEEYKNKLIKNVVIILAGGSGKRFGASIPKQYLDLNGKPVIDYVINAAIESKNKDKIIVVINEECKKYSNLLENENIVTVDNGKERHYSVLNALNYIKENYKNCEKIIILDSVSPFVKKELIDNYFDLLDDYDFVSTAKRITGELANNKLQRFNRNEYFILNSPEAYKFKLLYDNFNPASNYTEIAYQLPRNIKFYYNLDFPQNLKITYDYELEYAKYYLKEEKNDKER